MISPNCILVTGGSGFLGSHIVRRARAEGCKVISAYRNAKGGGAVPVDVCDQDDVKAVFRAVSPSIVIHCAAYGVNYADQDFARALQVNIQGSLHVLNCAAQHGVRRLVHVGSAVEYGSLEGLISEEAALNPTAIYGSTKAAGTILMRQQAQALDVPLVVARPFALWGPGEGMHHLIPQVVSACVRRIPLRLTTCEVLRDYTYVEDMSASILALARKDDVPVGTVVNMGSGEGQLLRDFVRSIAKLLDGEHLMEFGALPSRPTEMRSLVPDITRMHSLLGAGAATPLAEGVRRMVALYSSRGFEAMTKV